MEKSVDLFTQHAIQPLSSHADYAELVSKMEQKQISLRAVLTVVASCGFAVSILQPPSMNNLFEVLIAPVIDVDVGLEEAFAADITAHVRASTVEDALAAAFVILDSSLHRIMAAAQKTGTAQRAVDSTDLLNYIVPSDRTIN